jgi:hypothetical protein
VFWIAAVVLSLCMAAVAARHVGDGKGDLVVLCGGQRAHSPNSNVELVRELLANAEKIHVLTSANGCMPGLLEVGHVAGVAQLGGAAVVQALMELEIVKPTKDGRAYTQTRCGHLRKPSTINTLVEESGCDYGVLTPFIEFYRVLRSSFFDGKRKPLRTGLGAYGFGAMHSAHYGAQCLTTHDHLPRSQRLILPPTDGSSRIRWEPLMRPSML